MRSRKRDSWVRPTSGRNRRSSSGIRAGRVVAVLVVVVLILGGLATVQLVRAVPKPTLVRTTSFPSSIPGTAVNLPWPSQGSGIAVVPGVGVLGSFGANQQYPIASLAKMMTVYLTVLAHPISLGQSGPSLTLTQADYNTYLQDLAAVDSVMAVAPGETLTEYQLLEAMLLPSADNIATTVAIWDAGSVSAFVARMNAEAKKLGMDHTTYTDPSGVASTTVSTPSDQLILARLVESNPVLAQIMALPQATLPVAGVVYNVNYDLGQDGIVGIKTGSTPSGGDFAFDANVTTSFGKDSVIGVVLGQIGTAPLISALNVGKTIAASAGAIPTMKTVVTKGERIGRLVSASGKSVSVVASAAVTVQAWPGLAVSTVTSLKKLHYPVPGGTVVGHLRVSVGEQTQSVALVTAGRLAAPTLSWRLLRL